MSFNIAQTFYLDPDVVKKSAEAGFTSVDLYFRHKPLASGNKSGITNPGVEVTIVNCINGIPNIAQAQAITPNEPTEHGSRFNPRYEIARQEWQEIQVSSDASIPCRFKFKNPILVKTGYEYAIVVKFDGNEDFILWNSKQGDLLVGTNQISPGPSGKYAGNYYTYISAVDIQHGPPPPTPLTGNTAPSLVSSTLVAPPDTVPNFDYLISSWRPIPSVDLKFTVYVARYMHNGVPVSANLDLLQDQTASVTSPNVLAVNTISNGTFIVVAPQNAYEHIVFDTINSSVDEIRYGEVVYQEQPFWPGGTATPLTVKVEEGSTLVVANGSYVPWSFGGLSFNANNGWNKLVTGQNREHIIIKSGNDIAVREVDSIDSNTELIVTQALPFTNTAAYFYISPIGNLWSAEKTFFDNKVKGYLCLNESNANSSVRFTNYRIESIDVTANGSGYSNTDYLRISGFEYVLGDFEGGYNAFANIVTNSSGNIVSVYVSNTGCNFTNSSWITGSNVQIINSSSLASTGSGATFNYNIGNTLRTEFYANNKFANCVITDIQISRIKPEITINNPLGTSFSITHRTQYYKDVSPYTQSGNQTRLRSNPAVTDTSVKTFNSTAFAPSSNTTLTSRSNEFVIRYANNVAANLQVIGTPHSNSSVFLFEITSNNDFVSSFFEPEIINAHYSRYLINNDYTNEHTNYGNAVAKHIGTKVNFAQDRTAEDILVYLTAYRPLGTDIKVFARVHNTKDPEAFDDKDWTLLDLIDGVGTYSSLEDETDFYEYTFNFPSNPNTSLLTGTVRITEPSPYVIVGSGTNFTSDLAANDMIKVRSSIIGFDQIYFVGVVNSVVNATSLTLTTPVTIGEAVSSNSFYDTDLKVEKVLFPHQAFNNIQNDNVVRYYNSDLEEFNGYNTFQIKMVMLSNNFGIVPKIDDVRAIGVTA